MTVDLCRVSTDDGLDLDGALWLPKVEVDSRLPVDAFLLVHGTGSNFYAPGVLQTFAEQAVAADVPTLRINTRGHDGICSNAGINGSKPGGATYEVISECRNDLRAWIRFLGQRGYEKIVLVGHSMGGVKSIYTLAHDVVPEVKCVIGISPPRFCHANFMSHPGAEAFRVDFSRAQELVNVGQEDELIAVKQPLPFIATAGGYIAKYGPADEYDEIRHLPNVPVPTRIIIGTQTIATSPAFDGLPEAIEEIADRHPNLSLRLIEGADINYSRCPETPFADAWEWLAGLEM